MSIRAIALHTDHHIDHHADHHAEPIAPNPSAPDPSAPDPSAPDPSAPDPLLDHLVYATPNLDATLAEFRMRTGLEPAAGGRHLGLGTRNYLVGFGPSSYLEIVGPDIDNPPDAGREMPFGIASLEHARLVTWAIHPIDIEASAAASARAGADHGPMTSMQRDRPDGVRLEWRLTTTTPLPLDGVTPFLIDWGSSPHPAGGELPRAELVSLRGCYPEPDAVSRVMSALDAQLPVAPGGPQLFAVIRAPRGLVQLS